MSAQTIPALAENSGLAFTGERRRTGAVISSHVAQRLLGARNSHGKPNSDVVRPTVSLTDRMQLQIRWQIDFPAGMDESEAKLYAAPFRHLYRSLPSRKGRWWANRHANERLRAVLGRCDRFLSAAARSSPPRFHWIESGMIPEATLLVVARDDDFISGILQSDIFALWWRQFPRGGASVRAVESFPFPWPPSTGLSALTAVQEEARHAVARAARQGEAGQLHSAVRGAYGWSAHTGDPAIISRLSTLHGQRIGRQKP
jgi:hypothetical protein